MESNEQAYIEDERFELKTELERAILENFRDPICLGIINITNSIKKPSECVTCRQLFCYDCAHDLLNRKQDCPLCRKTFAIGPINHKLLNIILDITCKCKNYKKGCPLSEALKNLVYHEKQCEYKNGKEMQLSLDKILIKNDIQAQEPQNLMLSLEDLRLDDETFNEIIAAGAFGEDGVLDYAKIESIIISKKAGLSENSKNEQQPSNKILAQSSYENRLSQEQGSGNSENSLGNVLAKTLGHGLGKLLKSTTLKGKNPKEVFVNFIESLYDDKAGQKKGVNSEETGPKITEVKKQDLDLVTKDPQPWSNANIRTSKADSLHLGPIEPNKREKTENLGFHPPVLNFQAAFQPESHSNSEFIQNGKLQMESNHKLDSPSNTFAQDTQYLCPANHPLLMIQNLKSRPSSKSSLYANNQFICRQCLELKTADSNGLAQCFACEHDICPNCLIVPKTCKNNHVMQRTTDLVKTCNYRVNQAVCDICAVKIKPEVNGIYVCRSCRYNVCLDCFKVPVFCAKGHLLRRESKLSLFSNLKYKCSRCGKNKELLEQGIAVLACNSCTYYCCEDCFVNSKEQMKFFCENKHFLRRIFKFENASLFSMEALNIYTCKQCKLSKKLNSKGVWNCSICSTNLCIDCVCKQ